ncbi:MAG: tetratricopeptide repeat protein [Pseudomonadota bacterium]
MTTHAHGGIIGAMRASMILLAALLASAYPGAVVAGQAAAASPADAAVEAPASATAGVTAGADAVRRERDSAYLAFRREFGAKRYVEALPLAVRVVALTEQAGANAELPSALNNLAATHFQLGDYAAAEKTYVEALRLVEESQGATSRRLVAPLRGLANTYVAGGRKEAAIPLFERAVAIVRRSDGLFDPGQVALLEPLTEAYVSQGRWLDAEQAHQYQFRLAERQHGNTTRLIPALTRLAKWYEETGRYTQARRTWARQYGIASDRKAGDLAGAVNALRGMARTYKLEYQYGPEIIEDDANRAGDLSFRMDVTERDPFGRRVQSMSSGDFRLDPQGREFLEAALAMFEKHDTPAPLATATLLVELGDWTLLSDRAARAQPFYERAWPLLPRDENTAEKLRNPLLYPGQLLYRAPNSARRHASLPPDMVIERAAVAEFTVTSEGRVRDARIVEGTASEAQRNAFLSALSRAVYRPRFVDGKPVETQNVRLRQTFRVLKTDEAAQETPEETDSAATGAAAPSSPAEEPASRAPG